MGRHLIKYSLKLTRTGEQSLSNDDKINKCYIKNNKLVNNKINKCLYIH